MSKNHGDVKSLTIENKTKKKQKDEWQVKNTYLEEFSWQEAVEKVIKVHIVEEKHEDERR